MHRAFYGCCNNERESGKVMKDELLKSMLDEIRIIKFLATKIPPGALRYRPSAAQRSMLDLMQYLTVCAIVPSMQAVTGSWEHAEEMEKAADAVNQLNFDRSMDNQAKALKELFNDISSHDFAHKEATMPWGTKCKLGQGLMDMGLKALVAYRMQFFLYVKASGRPDLGPAQCWVGVDPQPKPAKA